MGWIWMRPTLWKVVTRDSLYYVCRVINWWECTSGCHPHRAISLMNSNKKLGLIALWHNGTSLSREKMSFPWGKCPISCLGTKNCPLGLFLLYQYSNKLAGVSGVCLQWLCTLVQSTLPLAPLCTINCTFNTMTHGPWHNPFFPWHQYSALLAQ